MRNKYAGVCYRCGKQVNPGEGHFEKVQQVHYKKHGDLLRGEKWLTQHSDCAIKYRGTDQHYKRTTAQ